MKGPLLAAALCVLFSTSPAVSEVHTVRLIGRQFVPSAISIAPGDTVKWVWTANGHDVVSGSAGASNHFFASSRPGKKGMVYRVKFSPAFISKHPAVSNVYNYFCSYHFKFGMVGSITVQ